MAGDTSFSEVRFDGVEVPASALLGAEGDGWRVATRTLSNERAGVANEILIWITLQGVLGNLKPSFTDYICGKDWSTAATPSRPRWRRRSAATGLPFRRRKSRAA